MASIQIKDIISTQTSFNDTDNFVLQESAGTTKKTVWSTIKSQLKSYFDTIYASITGNISTVLKSASYVILDNDGYQRIEVDTTSGDITITLPLKSNNLGRRIEIANVKGGTNKVIISPNATDANKLSGDALNVMWLPKIGDFIVFQESANSGYWEVINERITSQLRLNTYAGYGSTDNKIMRFTNSVENVGNMFSENHSTGYSSNTKGLEITINRSGMYSIYQAIRSATGIGAELGVSINSANLTTAFASLAVGEVLFIGYTPGNVFSNTGGGVFLKKGDVLRTHLAGSIPASNGALLIVTYLGQ